jgi:hypothetical protein
MERVGRTSTVVEAIGEDPVVHGEVVVSEDPVAVGEDPSAVSGKVGMEADVEEVGEPVDEAPVVDPMAVSEVAVVDPTMVQASRRSRSECVGGGEMIVARVRVLGRHTLKKKNSSDRRG